MSTQHAGLFSAADIVDIAVQTEQAGYVFYQAAAEAATDANVKELCEWLAEEEQVHEKIFLEMRKKLPARQSYAQGSETTTEFVNALIGSRFMPNPEQAQSLVKDMSGRDILDFALNFEKDTIIFLYEMRDLVPANAIEQVNNIIAEEKTHLSRISKAKAALT